MFLQGDIFRASSQFDTAALPRAKRFDFGEMIPLNFERAYPQVG